MRTSISRGFRQFVLNKYPSLNGNLPFLRFFRYLCFGDFHDKQTKQLVVPTKKMAEEFFEVEYECHFNGLAVLEQFRSEILPDLSWSGHEALSANSWNGKARRVTRNGFDIEMQDALRNECISPSEDQVDFVTGEPYSRQDRYQGRKAATAAYEKELGNYTLNGTQRKILDYLSGINAGHLFLRKLGENKEAIEQAITELDPALRDIQYRILANVNDNPNLYYLPSTRERTCRLSPRGDSIVGLTKDVRKAATRGWWECDLRSSQFAILAAKLKAPVSQAFIATGRSLWRELYCSTSGDDIEPPQELKAVLKEAIYSLCFGKSKKHLKEFLVLHGMTCVLKHPIFSELLELRASWFDEIELAGGAHDVWGAWHAIDDENGRWAGSIGASVIQSIEMEIIAPVFDVAIKHGKADQFMVTLFQHDGCTISFSSAEKIARAQAKLKKAVENRAAELGVSTILEFTQL